MILSQATNFYVHLILSFFFYIYTKNCVPCVRVSLLCYKPSLANICQCPTLSILVLYSFLAVERGLAEIRRLDIETQLWDESRRELEQDADNSNVPGRSDF